MRLSCVLVMLASFGALCGACGSSSTPGSSGDAGAASDAGAADGAVSAGAYTLANCTTSIAADAPSFYRRYFKCVTVTNAGTGVQIMWNGLPPHPSYYYGKDSPNYADFDVTRGPDYRANPNKIIGRTTAMTVPNEPASRGVSITPAMVDRTVNTNPGEYRGGAVGVAIDSVSIFNDQAGPGDDIDNEKFTFDSYNAHPTQDGSYHYHTVSMGPLEVLKSLGFTTNTTPGEASLEVYGIMCDGTVVLGCTELDGVTLDANALDAQGGHLGDLKDKDGTVHFANRYHTHVCPKLFASHPYTPEIQYYSTCTLR